MGRISLSRPVERGDATALGAAKSNVVLAIGDSISSQGAPVVNNGLFQGSSYLMWAAATSQRRAWIPGVFTTNGITAASGAKTSDNLTNHVTPAIKSKPGVIVVESGINDVLNDVATATILANLQTIYETIRAAGIVPVATTLMPRDGTTVARRQAIADVNAWMTAYAADTGMVVCDFNAAVVDPATGNTWRAGWTTDGLHPSSLGARAMGEALGAKLAAGLPDRPFLLPLAVTTRNLFPNGLFAGTGGFPTNMNWAAGTLVSTLVDGAADGVKGNWWHLSKTDTAAASNGKYSSDVIAVTAGNTMAMAFKMKAATVGRDIRMRLMDTTLAQNICGVTVIDQDPTGIVTCWAVGVVPVGVTQAKIRVEFLPDAATGTLDLAQLGVYDLTALGIVALP